MSRLKIVGKAMSKIGKMLDKPASVNKGRAMLKKAPAVDAKKKAAVKAKIDLKKKK